MTVHAIEPAPPPFVQIRRPDRAPKKMVELQIDGTAVKVPEGTTILGACRTIGIEIPTLCYLETLRPVNVCRVCMVEVEGSRVLVPSCSRAVEGGMVVRTGNDRVRHTRKMVLELLASSVDLSTTPGMGELLEEYECKPERYGPPAPPAAAGVRDAAVCGHHAPPNPEFAATVAQPPMLDNDLYIRDYAKCVLCYKCVEACGVDHQNTFAIAVAGRGFDARISTELAVTLPDSACVYCGNCIAVCPTGALMAKREFDMRADGSWNESEQKATDTICPYCGVGCTLTLHVQDNEIVKATSPLDNGVTMGNLCIKGRFGWRFVQRGPEAGSTEAGSRKRGSRKRGSRKRGSRKPDAMMAEVPARERAFVRLDGETSAPGRAPVAEEVPVAFVYSGRAHVVMMCSPENLEDLAYGFSLTEGIVASAAEIERVDVAMHSRGAELAITIPVEAAERLAQRARALAGRTGCGLCGVEVIDDAVRPVKIVETKLTVSPSALWRAGEALEAHQPLNRETRAVHAAAWATADGMLAVVREDVGRHNALDKVLGALARAGTDPSAGFLVVTSRASFELVQKAAAAGVAVLAAVSRPTGLAVKIADASGIALVGLLRGRTANVYSHPERIT